MATSQLIEVLVTITYSFKHLCIEEFEAVFLQVIYLGADNSSELVV